MNKVKQSFELLHFVDFDKISDRITNKYYTLCSIKIVLPNIHIFEEVPKHPKIVVRELGQIISNYVIKKLDKIKKSF